MGRYPSEAVAARDPVLDPQSRLRVHEIVDLAGFDGTNLVAGPHRDVWELRAATPRGDSTPVDSQHRVSVPVGVRHQLGLAGPVLVSLAADRSRIVISSSVRLDALLEVPS